MKTGSKLSLGLPPRIGAKVLAHPEVHQRIQELKGVRVTTDGEARPPTAMHHDLAATMVWLLGAAGSVAAIKGFFELARTVVQEVYAERRQTSAEEHEIAELVLLLGVSQRSIDSSVPLSQAQEELGRLEAEALAILKNAQ